MIQENKLSDKKEVDKSTIELYNKAVQYIEEKKLYLDSEITIGEIAEELKVSMHQLSYAINTVGQKNFFEFINNYRINEARKLLKSSSVNFTIEAIAFDSGFGSKAAFNRTFKKYIGITPSEYAKGGQDNSDFLP
ncbi:MAG: AraC family transcriptional regulator [Cytophagaceae bacterium]|nr:AraC family transcriptional regulator [Cytophagaceae bacterium]